MKPNCSPYRWLQGLVASQTDVAWKVLTVSDIINFSPHFFREKIDWMDYADEQRRTRIALENVKQKLIECGLSKKDGAFMTGQYHVTEWSPKEDWVQHWISELGFTKKEAEKTYELAKKAKLL